MNIVLTPEMETLIRHYMAHGSYPSPESVVMQALKALRESEAMHTPEDPTPPHPDDLLPAATPPGHASPLAEWLQTTAGPHEGLEALHRRLAAISGSMAETVRAERDERL
jgi:Arc/MetJ-type ribon-helix-helix transcriptional regulator